MACDREELGLNLSKSCLVCEYELAPAVIQILLIYGTAEKLTEVQVVQIVHVLLLVLIVQVVLVVQAVPVVIYLRYILTKQIPSIIGIITFEYLT